MPSPQNILTIFNGTEIVCDNNLGPKPFCKLMDVGFGKQIICNPAGLELLKAEAQIRPFSSLKKDLSSGLTLNQESP